PGLVLHTKGAEAPGGEEGRDPPPPLDEPVRPPRRGGRAGLLAQLRRGLVLDRCRVRHLGRPGELLRAVRPRSAGRRSTRPSRMRPWRVTPTTPSRSASG